MNKKLNNIKLFGLIVGILILLSCNNKQTGIHFTKQNELYHFESDLIRLDITNLMNIKVYQKEAGKLISMVNNSEDPYYIIINGEAVKNFVINKNKIKLKKIETSYGRGKQLVLTGETAGPLGSLIKKRLIIEIYEAFPEAAVINVTYSNVHSTPGLIINKEIDCNFNLDASLINKKYDPFAFWIFQGGSYKERPDWILPVSPDFSCENYQGQQYHTKTFKPGISVKEMDMADTQQLDGSEVGGGVPVIDVWCKETGLFIGSLNNKPTLISLPARVDEKGWLNIGIHYIRENLSFEKKYITIPTVVGLHHGDYYDGLKTYAGLMSRMGFEMPVPTDDAYKAIWCGWGFGPDFTQEQMIDMIPLVKKLGFKVVTVDAGWFYKNGDLIPRDDTFPEGEEGMKKFVKKFHDAGLKIKLWITTHIAGPELEKEHPEWLIRNVEGKSVGFSYLGEQVTPYICPALKEVQEYHRKLVRKFIGEWDFDGFKVDQNLINSTAGCYAESHHHQYPEESVETLPQIYKVMFEEMVKLKPDAILEVCPCGMVPSFYKMPYYNQPVSSDFNTPWQIRHRGKTIKALMGSRVAYYGDHVERHFSENNFPSIIGVGGIPGSMMVSKPEDNVEFLRIKYPCFLSPEREEHFVKWLEIYNEYQLSKGEYLNLYDIAFDKPEAHTIKKGGIMYYAFYAHHWQGEIEFRGLGELDYTIVDYTNGKEIGTIHGNGTLKIQFDENLLVKAIPE